MTRPNPILTFVITLAAVTAGQRALFSQEITVETAPPVVVKTVPAAGAVDVDPALAEIRVTFSKDMQDGNFSVVKASELTFPKLSEKPRYDKDGRTCVLPVKLEAGRDYALWLNTQRFGNFKDQARRSAVPYLLVFRTKGNAAAQADAPKPDFAAAFDALADDMADHYSYFALKGVDWKALRQRYRSRAAEADSEFRLVGVLREMLANLNDGHVWIDFEGQRLSTGSSPRPPDNYNRAATLSTLEAPRHCGAFSVVGTIKGTECGAVVLTDQTKADASSVADVVAFIQEHRDAPGFLLDLRSANGGDERLAQTIASRFCPEDVVYARSRYRDGPEPTDFGPPQDRMLRASEGPYTRPVVCLIGPGCVSSGEGFAKMMAALPHVTLVGAPTRGSSGNPKPFPLPGTGIAVWYSRWVDLMPDGSPVEGRGVQASVRVDAPPGSHDERDPTWEKALEVLRSKVGRPQASVGSLETKPTPR